MLYAFTTLLLATLVAGDCVADNCLRAFRATQTPGRLQAAQSFCATFSQTSVAATAIPSYIVDACKENQNGSPSLRISSACSCIVTTTPSPTSSTGPRVTAACAIVSSSWAAQIAVSPSATPTVSASLAYDCLNSVPLNKEAAIELVAAMEPYLEWQTDSAYLKDPPADYFYPPHDIFAYLASVGTNLQNDKYANEYEFQEDLYQIFARAHDGHFVFYPDALTKAIQWGRKRSLVSISEDGSSLPVIKLYEDVVSSPSTASIVSLINGIDASTYVADYVYTASFNQDPDAAYNTMFFEKAFFGGGDGQGYFSGGGRVRYIYPGPNTTFTFDNGTYIELDNIALVKSDWTGVTDGSSFYQVFCTGPSDAAEAAASVDAVDSGIIVPGYPTPVVITNDSVVSGYYLDGEGYDDVAVLSLLAFESESYVEFQAVQQEFFADAVAAGKTKLVIDLSANGGGYILQGYDTFRQLFPDIIQDGYTRWRENDVFMAISQVYSADSADFNPRTATNNQIGQYESTFNYHYDLNLTDQPFELFDAKFAPHVFKGDNFTNIMRWNLNDPLTTSNATYGLGSDVTGYGSRTNFTQPFAAENIILLLDGYCASTCTLFTEFMRTQAGIKSIAMGGRPKTGPIQGVGGIKGAEILGWGDIYGNAQEALSHAETSEQTAILSALSDLPVNRSSSSGINVRDNILPDHLNDGLPAQFVVEDAECRLYWTLPMITDVTAVWKAAADAAFNGRPCAAGALPKRDLDLEVETRRTELEKRNPAPRGRRDLVVEKDSLWFTRHGRKAIP